MADEKTAAEPQQEAAFDGETIVKSAKYKRYADILTCLLSEGQLYTHAQIDEMLKKALSQPVAQDINE